jgi:hypothetical protein
VCGACVSSAKPRASRPLALAAAHRLPQACDLCERGCGYDIGWRGRSLRVSSCVGYANAYLAYAYVSEAREQSVRSRPPTCLVPRGWDRVSNPGYTAACSRAGDVCLYMYAVSSRIDTTNKYLNSRKHKYYVRSGTERYGVPCPRSDSERRGASRACVVRALSVVTTHDDNRTKNDQRGFLSMSSMPTHGRVPSLRGSRSECSHRWSVFSVAQKVNRSTEGRR